MISDKFTIDDIHQIRYENYENTKDMKPEELISRKSVSACFVNNILYFIYHNLYGYLKLFPMLI